MKIRSALPFAALCALWANNTSLFHSPPPNGPGWIAHRGVHQTFEGLADSGQLTGSTCTAARIDPPTHGFIENTQSSVDAAWRAGAGWVEIDLRVSADGALVVFHDESLGCRTDGSGPVRGATLAEIRELDPGYGYTADGGQSFPLRGRVSERISTLGEVLDANPGRAFVLDMKDLSAEEGARVAEALRGRDHEIMATGTEAAVGALSEAIPGARPLLKRRIKRCVLEYAALGWSGYVPAACRGEALMIPSNYAPWLWGWPHRLAGRLEAADSALIVLGARRSGERFTRGVDSLEEAEALGAFGGWIWTNRIEALGPGAQ